jgi:hypothetical protein
MGDAKAASKYQRASQLEEIGYLTKEMMYNKYDDKKSLTIKKIMQRLNYFFCQSCGTSCKKDNAMLAKNGTPLPRRFKNKKGLGKVNQPFEPRTQAFENKRNSTEEIEWILRMPN